MMFARRKPAVSSLIGKVTQAWLAAGLAVLLAAPVTAQTSERLSPDQLRGMASAAMANDDFGAAVAMANALLARNPNDVSALFIRAEAAARAGDFVTARKFAVRAYRTTQNPANKYQAARLTALAFAQAGQDTRAQIWLRRARQWAPNNAEAESVAKDYRVLRDRNPWSTTLRFGITPSNNINNGSSSATSQLFGLPFDFTVEGAAFAISGYEISGGVQTRYKLSEGRNHQTFLNFSVDARTYAMSDEAKDIAPDSEGRDFADTIVEVGVTHRQVFWPNAQPTEFGLRLGQNWYGGDKQSRYAEFSLGHSWQLGERNSISARLSYQRQESLVDDPLLTIDSVNLGWGHRFANNDRLSLTLGYRDANSDRTDNDYESRLAAINYDFARDWAGMRFGVGYTRESRHFDANSYAAGPRDDETDTLRLDIAFSNFEFYGFQPVMTIERSRTDSNIGQFERDTSNISFDFRSAF